MARYTPRKFFAVIALSPTALARALNIRPEKILAATGGKWPGTDDMAPLGNCIVLSAEDTDEDVLVPRLIAAGADLKRVAIVHGTKTENGVRKFNLQKDIKQLEELAKQIGNVKLVSIDPISSYLGGDIDSHNNTELRDALDPIKGLAERCGAAVVSITHFSKAAKGVSALNRIIGSIAFTAAPRAAFVVVRDDLDPERRLFLPVKSNLMSFDEAYGMSFRIEKVDIGRIDPDTKERIEAPRVAWGEREGRSADAVLNPVKEKEEGTALREAKEFLCTELNAGKWELASDVKAWARDADISEKTLQRAREGLGVECRKRKQKDGHGPWEWTLPKLFD